VVAERTGNRHSGSLIVGPRLKSERGFAWFQRRGAPLPVATRSGGPPDVS
jgi:hypothetical protein